ncbi:MAG TPA: peptidoglycan DD-metalloendopeptidase family protein [Candidatus Udaeobacter sp.]|nr:peptidoglycan DD-metalloendopeptidase family protein [Candidatus Udaeobacter sp.]
MKESRFRLQTTDAAALRPSLSQRARGRLDRWFPPRELILRTDGRVAYLAISSRQQKITAAILFGFAIWGAFATTNMVLSGRQLAAKRGELDRAQTAYVDLLNEMTRSYDDLLAFARNVDKNQANQLASGESGNGDNADIPGLGEVRQRQLSLRDKLQNFGQDLQAVASRNQQLSDAVSQLRDQLQVAQSQNTSLNQSREEVNAQLQNTRQQLASELTAMQQVLSQADGRKQILANQVTQLQGDLTDSEHHEAEADLARKLAEEQIAMLLDQLNSARADNTHLKRQVTDAQTALNTAITQREALQSSRRDLTGRIGDLENQLATIQRSQQTIVDRLAARTRNGVDEVEKTVAMTGVDVDGLLLRAAHALSGQGGPFIPVKDPPSGTDGTLLMASVASLDGEVGRLETLQLVLKTLPLMAPIDHYFIASPFGIRKDPFNGRFSFHPGLDLANALLSPVLSTSPGVVVFAGWRGGYGRMVEIDHGLGVHTRYGHLARIDVAVGDAVDYRQQIGLLGSSGRSTGPHVHYEVLIDGRPMDPMNFLKAGRYVFKG